MLKYVMILSICLVAFNTSNMVLSTTINYEEISHSGRTDKNGCHVDRKTGKRHCHP